MKPKILMRTDRRRKTIEKKNRVLKKLHVEYIPIQQVLRNFYNPNRQNEHDFKLLLQSIQEDGFTQPIICLKITQEHYKEDPRFKQYKIGDIVVVDGEHRWRAAQQLGMTEIPVVIVDMTPKQMRIATLRHNRARGGEDIELFSQILRDLKELGALDWAKDSLLLSNTEIDKLINDIQAPEMMANSEFSQAWEPIHETNPMDAPEETKEKRIGGISSKALGEGRDLEERIKQAKTVEEKRKIRKESSTFKIEFVYTKDEADVIKQALGTENPAAQLLVFCKTIIGNTARHSGKKPKIKKEKTMK